jgi:transposase
MQMTTPPFPSIQDPDYLPDTVPECHKLIKELRGEIARLQEIVKTVETLNERVAELEKQVRRRNRKIFGQSSAKVPAASLTGTGKVVYDQSKEELESERANLELVPEEKTHGGGGRNITKNGPTERPVEHRITDSSKLACPCCGKQRRVIGFNTSYQLDVLQTVFELVKHIEYKYGCPDCEGQIVAASKPYQPIDKGYPAPALIAHVATSKFDWHLPLYRQERIYLSQGVSIARSSMCRWLKGGADELSVIVKRMHELILRSRVIQSDDTTMPVIKKGLGKTHQGYTWLYRGDDDYPYIIYDFTETHEGAHPARMLSGFDGILQTDGASVYNQVIDKGATRAGCLSHAFRYFEDARREDQERADHAIAIMKSLFDIERVASGLTEDERKQLRRRLAKPKFADLKVWLDEQIALPKEALGEAITYCQNQWEALCLYADTGHVSAHNSNSENGLRPAVLGRRNFLFAGSVEGGHTGAIWMSLIQTCRRLSINPFDYLKDTLTRLPSTPITQIDQFLPDRWKALRENQS